MAHMVEDRAAGLDGPSLGSLLATQAGHPGLGKGPWTLTSEALTSVLEGLRGCCRNQLATRTLHPPEDPESENQPGSPLARRAAVSVSWWWSLPALPFTSSQALGQGSHCSPGGLLCSPTAPLSSSGRRCWRPHSQWLLRPLPCLSSSDTRAAERDCLPGPSRVEFPGQLLCA